MHDMSCISKILSRFSNSYFNQVRKRKGLISPYFALIDLETETSLNFILIDMHNMSYIFKIKFFEYFLFDILYFLKCRVSNYILFNVYMYS